MVIPKVNFLDILIITSPITFIRKVWGQDRRICSLILGVKGPTTEMQDLSANVLFLLQSQMNFTSEMKTSSISSWLTEW